MMQTSGPMSVFTSSAVAVVAAFLLQGPQGALATPWALQQCKGETCADPKFPIMDYDGSKCICRMHPCWVDDGKLHTCTNSEAPYLTFAYKEDGGLICSCRKFPHMGSVYVAEKLCPGQACDGEEHPILDWDPAKNSCVCTSHPCLNDDGKMHSCATDEFPILTFAYKADGGLSCGCSKKYVPPDAEL
jgi:hypothetical protein